jgi:hypothetical protein
MAVKLHTSSGDEESLRNLVGNQIRNCYPRHCTSQKNTRFKYQIVIFGSIYTSIWLDKDNWIKEENNFLKILLLIVELNIAIRK